ncbi:MAG: hypothetical protein D3908_09300 [Candidatus Electrothrix sp. AUS4]|nr:hypothetical protein [Candidatus Electrothrix sp. AUS4]
MKKKYFFSADNQPIKLRPFPYPFKAGLAVCSDIDECDLQTFIAIHRFLNSKKHGLGLPVADSFFGVASDDKLLAYFNPDGSPRPKEGEFIQQALKDGLIDSLHAWGDFNAAPPDPIFLQKIARNLTDELTKEGLQIPIWINHGSGNNRQNLQARLWPQYQGDAPHTPYYTMKYINALGIKYHWLSELMEWPLSVNSPKAYGKTLQRLSLNKIKNGVKTLLGHPGHAKSSQQLTQLTNKIHFRDGSSSISFTRFARHPKRSLLWGAGKNSLRHSLTETIYKELIQDEGYAVVYTHLAKAVANEKGKKVFPQEEKQSLKLLADYYNSGQIWVATTSQLLQFKTVHDHLEWHVANNEGDDIRIEITGINDPVSGKRIPDLDELAGICFYSPEPGKTSINLIDKRISKKNFRTDSTGGGWIGLDIPAAPTTGLVED